MFVVCAALLWLAVTQEVTKLAAVREVPQGEALFSFGEVPDSFFLILKVGGCSTQNGIHSYIHGGGVLVCRGGHPWGG